MDEWMPVGVWMDGGWVGGWLDGCMDADGCP